MHQTFSCHYRCTMSTWTPDRSTLLSDLLAEVIGSQEEIYTRQDYCKLRDALDSIPSQIYYTGSKAEGLRLPGSDDDFMADINNLDQIKIVQSLHEASGASLHNTFLLCTENVKPGFALLRCINLLPNIFNSFALGPGTAIQSINGVDYLSSNRLVEIHFRGVSSILPFESNRTSRRQGPSIELWYDYEDKSTSGADHVLSIHCDFWPKDASEWRNRPRDFGWPTSRDISYIVDFGCHLVPIGHPNSETKLTEWRLSFSVAERALVWSFNQVQMQCYAVMKIILKEFIKERCSEQNQVLCSYFVKTFLFWKYESTELRFWSKNNFRECIKFLMNEFTECLRAGDLRHYFLPKFNLLSVKLTREAQAELIELFGIIIQTDIKILKECRTLRIVWKDILRADDNQMKIVHRNRRVCFLKRDDLMMHTLTQLTIVVEQSYAKYKREYEMNNIIQVFQGYQGFSTHPTTYRLSLDQLLTVQCKTCLKSLLMKQLQLGKQIMSLELNNSQSTEMTTLQEISQDNESFDVTTSKLWYAMVLIKKCEFRLALSSLNNMLSSISPFALRVWHYDSFESERLYLDNFFNSSCTPMQRAKQAWLTPLVIPKCINAILPHAIQIEQNFCDYVHDSLFLSPHVCAYYLMFLCYHELEQYDSRNHALRQLVDVVNNYDVKEDYGGPFPWYRDFNIAGHCMLISGKISQAREMFLRSRTYTLNFNSNDDSDAAKWYIENFCSATNWCKILISSSTATSWIIVHVQIPVILISEQFKHICRRLSLNKMCWCLFLL